MEKIIYGIAGRFEEDGRVSYYKEGLLHREDGPAREFDDGTKLWFINDIPHRLDGPAHESAEGLKIWFVNGKRHREDGPALVRADGTKEWWINGQRHREDGPAIEYSDGKVSWWFNGIKYDSEEDFPGDPVKIIKKSFSTLSHDQLAEVANIVQEMISLRQSTEPSVSPEPNI